MPQRQYLKAINRSSILNTIKLHGPVARADIARLTNLSPATITLQTSQLIDDGLVFEQSAGDSRGGRPPILLALNDSIIRVVGIKLMDTTAIYALTDLNAEILATDTTSLPSRQPRAVAQHLAEGVEHLLKTTNTAVQHVLGVGVGLAGIIDSAQGICRQSAYGDWHDVPLAALIQDYLDYPVYLDNDVNTLTLIERLYGLGQNVDDFVVITIGRGVGMGLVAHGLLYRGALGGAGEIGHTVVDPHGPRCGCGNYGCLETFVAEPWLVRSVNERGGSVRDAESLGETARTGDPIALEVLSGAGAVFGRAIANVINLLNPELIILAGEGIRLWPYMEASARDALRRHTFGILGDKLTFRVESVSDVMWARGAASLVLGQVFTAPSPVTVSES